MIPAAFDYMVADSAEAAIAALAEHGDEAKLLALFRLDVGRQVVRPEAQPFDLAERVHRHDWRAAHFGRDDRQGGAEEIGARIFDMIDRRQASELGIGFLDHVIDQETMLDAPRQPAPQRRFMRTYVARQPEGPAVLNRSAPSPRRSWLINEAPAQIRRIGGKIGA